MIHTAESSIGKEYIPVGFHKHLHDVCLNSKLTQ